MYEGEDDDDDDDEKEVQGLYLKNRHPKELNNFSCCFMAFERTLHETPVPEFVHNHWWP
jgi:hypothetical protein